MPMFMPASESTPLAEAPVPGQGDPFQVLDECHRQTLLALERLNALVLQVQAQTQTQTQERGPDPDPGLDSQIRSTARQLFQFFQNTARAHHQDEERHVFPGLLLSGDDHLVNQTLRLQQDHGWIEEDWRDIAPQLESMAAGYHWHNIDQLAQVVPVFTALYRDHIALEESLVYPSARHHLDTRALEGMGREMAWRRRQAPEVA